jgi:hypothetical protein
MKTKATLASALNKVARPQENSRKPPPSTAPVGAEPAPPAVAPSRLGKKAIGGFFDPAVSRQLKQIGIDHDKTGQDLLAEALNGLFQKYGKPPIA